jgi:hypothetical protein
VLPDKWLDTPDTSDGWTPRDVVGHLISAELDDWIMGVELILEQGTDRPFSYSIGSPTSSATGTCPRSS